MRMVCINATLLLDVKTWYLLNLCVAKRKSTTVYLEINVLSYSLKKWNVGFLRAVAVSSLPSCVQYVIST